jgi:hypothetical protein
MTYQATFVLNKSLDDYIDAPLTNSQVDGLRENKQRWDARAQRIRVFISFLFALMLLTVFGAVVPTEVLATLSMKGIFIVSIAGLVMAVIAYCVVFPISTWLAFPRHRFELTIGEMSFHREDCHQDMDFEFVRIDPAKIAHHEKAVCFLENIERMTTAFPTCNL